MESRPSNFNVSCCEPHFGFLRPKHGESKLEPRTFSPSADFDFFFLEPSTIMLSD